MQRVSCECKENIRNHTKQYKFNKSDKHVENNNSDVLMNIIWLDRTEIQN